MQILDVAVIIPVFNEEKVIKEVINGLSSKFKHIICVNDGSSDGTAAQILETNAYLIEHPINMGQGAAIQTGVEFARAFTRAEYFVTFDADGQHRVQDVLVMLEEIKKDKYDIILGSRFLGETTGIKMSKLIVLKLAIKFSNLTSRLRLTDTHNGLRVFNRRFADNLQITLPDMAHASEILEIIAQKNFRYKEVPVTIEYTEYSLAKGQSIINAVNIGFDTLLRKLTR